MPRIIPVPARASIAAIRAALAGARGREIALAFPLGIPCVAGTSEAMRELLVLSRALHKDVVILGGDEHLRAVAVAAGFPAATSVAEWEAATPRPPAMRYPRRNDDAGDHQELPPLSLVSRDDARALCDDPFEPFNELPPEFVLELMARDGAYGAPSADEDREAGIYPDDDATDEDELRAAHERYEERITRAIRHTGGLSLSSPSHPPIAPLPTVQLDPADGGDESSSM